MQALFGTQLLGLRALATGLPVSLLSAPLRAAAQSAGAADFRNPQFLILNTSGAGDPLNCNAPGTYLDPKIVHPADERLKKTSIMVGSTAYDAAAPWATLQDLAKAPNLFGRTSFIHHSTGTEQHLHQPEVHGLMGQVVGKDMAISAFAALLAPVLGTIQAQPVVIGTDDSSEAISYKGRPQPLLNPMSLATVLGSPRGALGTLQKLRDQDLNRLNALFKQSGTAAQRQFLDNHAQSQLQVRKLAQELLNELTSIRSNGPDAQMQAAIVLVKLKVAPVITVHIPFGGDNHFDGDLSKESDQTVSGMASLVKLMNGLGDASLLDKVSVGSFNVFGRTLLMQGAGRSHNRNHHMTLLIGKNVRGSVIGGVVPVANDYGAQAISSTTGRGDASGDIAPADSLASVGKTLGVALGIPREQVDKTVLFANTGASSGKVIQAALA
jgi:hypothetical protein